MPKFLHPDRFKIWLFVACLWLPACGLISVNESTPAVLKEDEPALESSSEQLSPNQAGVVDPLPEIDQDVTPVDCLSSEAQTLGEGIASSFEIPYELVMGWHCAGHAFEDILLALHTGDDLEIPPTELLARLDQGQTWEEIWKEIGWLK